MNKQLITKIAMCKHENVRKPTMPGEQPFLQCDLIAPPAKHAVKLMSLSEIQEVIGVSLHQAEYRCPFLIQGVDQEKCPFFTKVAL